MVILATAIAVLCVTSHDTRSLNVLYKYIELIIKDKNIDYLDDHDYSC